MYILPILSLLNLATALPQRNQGSSNRNGGNRNGATQRATAQQQAAQIPQGVSTAVDGSTILDDTVTVNGLPLRFRISAPSSQFLSDSGVPGASADSSNGTFGINILLHGDGGQSFFDFPNQAVSSNLLGIALLAPDPNLFWGGGSGLQRTDGVAHSQAVADFINDALPKLVSFDRRKVFFTGVSGGSLMLSGFFIPSQMSQFENAGVMLNCGGLVPQVDFVDEETVLRGTRIHWQSTQSELVSLQRSIPQAVAAYEKSAAQVGLGLDEINGLQTVDNSPAGGHCEFDGQGFSSGIQVMADAFADVMLGGGSGEVVGIGNVLNGVVGNERLRFEG
ncbi:hypothetical protein GQ43DRAFT_466362 [Delitschia confertaspora ATCC 74209]|uniref:Uncharacterized protein n=1 Tax=Delitschia confertaspora ATCC 74209 TaxID=1513339 RepID=A0A9P4JFT2_9PLEO|nr:hypothetical protein GQ43DRAFT_466362 [Delitschia confertaspora ATCC 74209]